MRRLLYICSSNRGKLREFELAARTWGAEVPYDIEPLPALDRIAAPSETGATFEANAKLKAEYYSQFTAELVFADDSGLQVEALAGAPGVLSARFAGPGASDRANNELLLTRLRGVEQRTARFVCALALAREGRCLYTARGTVTGEILQTTRGNGGFGYDPLFLYPAWGKTLAEAAPEEKLAVSHRGHALRELFRYLQPNSDGRPL